MAPQDRPCADPGWSWPDNDAGADACLVRMRRVADLDEIADQRVLLDDDLADHGELAAAAHPDAVRQDESWPDVVEELLDGHPHVLQDDHAVADLNEVGSRNSRR